MFSIVEARMTQEEKRQFRRHMRTPLISFAVLLTLLAINVTLGATLPFHGVWMLEAAVTLGMVLVVLLLSMEVSRDTPLIRVFSMLGFFWVAIMFTMTLTDYLAR
jgi:cytochrome c oxidase subunit 4